MSNSLEESQTDLVGFLSDGAAYGRPEEPVERITTHISHLFFVGNCAYKLKRAVKFPYLDFSTPERRRIAVEREVMLNRRTAPEIYLGVQPITRDPSGKFAIGTSGATVDWLVVMRRFDQDSLLDRMSELGKLDPKLLRDLADVIAAFHRQAEPARNAGGAEAMKAIIEGNTASFAACPAGIFDSALVGRLQSASLQRLDEIALLLDRRRDAGKVRHCHGDMHLGNIAVIQGRPTPFDCIEFDDRLAVIDVLYDLAFPLMDLLDRGLAAEANLVFNRYLDRSDESDGIAAMPLFMSIRAAVRAHVATRNAENDVAEARQYMELALRLLDRPPPRLVAVGGLSGTGKSTLAYRLAPEIGPAPGARVLRSDVTRKRLFGAAPERKLDPACYTSEATAKVYASLAAEASAILAAGHSVVLDAVHARPEERAAARATAQAAGVRFAGFWLEAPIPVLEDRLARRRDDASDADLQILRRQQNYNLGRMDWIRLDASIGSDQMLPAMLEALG